MKYAVPCTIAMSLCMSRMSHTGFDDDSAVYCCYVTLFGVKEENYYFSKNFKIFVFKLRLVLPCSTAIPMTRYMNIEKEQTETEQVHA